MIQSSATSIYVGVFHCYFLETGHILRRKGGDSLLSGVRLGDDL